MKADFELLSKLTVSAACATSGPWVKRASGAKDVAEAGATAPTMHSAKPHMPTNCFIRLFDTFFTSISFISFKPFYLGMLFLQWIQSI